MNIYERNFNRLVKLNIINQEGALQFKEAFKIQNKGYMDLNLDLLRCENKDSYVIAMAHNYEQHGDTMCDPDMEIKIFPKNKMIEALTFQQDNFNIYQEVYQGDKVNLQLKKELNSFLELWLKNLIEQGFKLDSDKGEYWGLRA